MEWDGTRGWIQVRPLRVMHNKHAGGGRYRTQEATSGGSSELSARLREKSNYHTPVATYFLHSSVTLSVFEGSEVTTTALPSHLL